MPEPVRDARPAALLVARNFPPLVGGMEKLNLHLLQALAERWRTGLCGPAGAAGFAPAGTVVAQTRLRPLPAFLAGTALRAVLLARRLRPQVVVAGSGVTAPMAWLAARAVGVPYAVYVHGLDLVAPSPLYQALWLPFIRRAALVIANSRSTAALAIGRGIDPARLQVLPPGVAPARHDPAAVAALQARLGLAGRTVLLSVGRLTPRKGLVEFVARCLPAIVARRPDVLLLVIGEDATAALNAGGGSERARLREAARAAGVDAHVLNIDHVDEAGLAAAYGLAHLHVFPVRALPGDVEGFGMVALEAAEHGLPTVAFDVGGVGDAVADGRSGWLLPADAYAEFAELVASLPLADAAWRAERARACRGFAAGFHWPRFGERVRALLEACLAGAAGARA